MLEAEPPRHTRLRAQVLRAFTSRSIAALVPGIEALAGDLATALPSGPFDLLDAFARPFPVRVIARLLGVPEADAPALLRWSNAMVGMYQARRTKAHEVAAAAAAAAFTAYLSDILRTRRTAPRDDLLTHLLAVSDEGGLTPEEVTATAILLLNAGHEATVHTLGNGVAGLIRAGIWGTEITDGLVEEILRHNPPLHLFTRFAQEDLDIFGHRFARGDKIGLLLAAANRDPAAFPDPTRFDPTRYPGATPSVSFGAGLHFCLGAQLARIEIKIGLQALVRARPALRLADTLRYADIYHFHGLEGLIVD
jgi:cytochrome P450